jgi:hypothetical protein
MGLLDDAIREHLELKRRHGADPQEVAREEDEALGSIRGREPQEREPATERDELDEPVLHDRVPEFDLDEPPAPVEEPAAVHPGQEELELPPLAEEDPEEPAVPADEPLEDVHQPTIEYSVGDMPEPPAPPKEPADEEPGEPGDELEETPEFLQETPEHDRLWFEQKPPRDFDF